MFMFKQGSFATEDLSLQSFLRGEGEALLWLARTENSALSPEEEERARRDAAGNPEALRSLLSGRLGLHLRTLFLDRAQFRAALSRGQALALSWNGAWLCLSHGASGFELRGPNGDTAPFSEEQQARLFSSKTPLEALWAERVSLDDVPAPSAWARLGRLLRLERRELWGLVIYAAVVGAISLAVPLAVQALVNTVAFGTLLQPVVVLALLLCGALAFAAWLRALQSKAVEILQERVLVRTALDLAFRLPRTRLDAFDGEAPPTARYFYDVVTVQKTLAGLSLDGLALALQTLIGLTLLALYHPLLLGLAVLLLGAVAFVWFGLGVGAVKTSQKESKAKHQLAGWLQRITATGLFRQSGGANLALHRADALARSYIEARRKHFKILFRQVIGALSVQVLASGLLLGLGGWLVIQGQLTIGQLVAAELVVSAVLSGISKLGKHLEALYDLLASADKLGTLQDIPRDPETGTTAPRSEGAVPLSVENLWFQYPNQTEPLLRGLSLSLPAGARVVLRGASGAGKTTLAQVVAGLRAPQRGVLWLDGEPLAGLFRPEYRERVALVESLDVFPGSIAENIHLWRPAVGSADLRRALEAVGLWGEVGALPEGLETRLNARGLPLSRGQLARLAVARALVGQPQVLVVDGVLEHLDPEAQTRLFQGLTSWEPNPTMLWCTHLPAALAYCTAAYELAGGTLRALPLPKRGPDAQPEPR
jgi:ABC-type bacteriocin/lantibiotic exporter with double-glycine peptidase domain